jgi:hypothetical protein
MSTPETSQPLSESAQVFAAPPMDETSAVKSAPGYATLANQAAAGSYPVQPAFDAQEPQLAQTSVYFPPAKDEKPIYQTGGEKGRAWCFLVTGVIFLIMGICFLAVYNVR